MPTESHDQMTIASSTLQTAARIRQLAEGLDRPALISAELPAEFAEKLLSEGLAGLRRRSLVSWEAPGRNHSLFGFGTALSLSGERTSTMSDASARLRAAGEGARVDDVRRSARPRWFGGGRFSPAGQAQDEAWDEFGGWQFVLPGVLLAVDGGRPAASLTLLVDPNELNSLPEAVDRAAGDALFHAPAGGAFPASLGGFSEVSRSRWEAAVSQALEELNGDGLDKVVMARCQRLPLVCAPDRGRLLTRLAGRYEQCYVFSFKNTSVTWLGASPELLCRVTGQTVEAESLAGSRPRGADQAEDSRLANDLLASAKERAEHALVAEAIVATLSGVCAEVLVAGEPSIMRMPNIQHLFTPVSGRLQPGLGVMDVVARLHPTPAVAGWPRAQAIEAIDRLEGMDRGWYAGPIGWVDFQGDGEFAVALRSALVAGAEARLYAGGGIVRGSVPEQEYAETEAKLRPVREALEID